MAGVVGSPSLLISPVSRPNFNNKQNKCSSQIHITGTSNHKSHSHLLPNFPVAISTFKPGFHASPIVKASVGSPDFVTEPGTSVKFPTLLRVPGCSDSLILLGKGFREKVFAIIGVKVYAAGLYVNQSILKKLNAWKGRSATEIQKDSSVFDTVLQATGEKSLQIVLVRDIDGKTFWDALDEAISPRIKEPSNVDKSALSTFGETFQGRSLKQGTVIFLTWVEPSKLLISISSDGLPTAVDASIESINITSALFDVFMGHSPVSPRLKASVADGLALLLK